MTRSSTLAAALWLTLSAIAAAQTAELKPLQAPLEYNGEFVEVTRPGTLRLRYHSHDVKKDIAFYLERARRNSRGRAPGHMRIVEVFIRQFDIVARHKNNPGGKIEAECRIPESFITETKEYEKLFSDFVFAMSDGAMQVEWLPPIVVDAPIRYDFPMDDANQWWFRPKWVEGQLAFLKDFKPNSADFMLFYLDVAKKKDGSLLWPGYGGMAWGQEELRGARLITLNDHELARGIHEWDHHIFDTTIQETEGLTVTRFHGDADAGYGGEELNWSGRIGSLNVGPFLAYYRDCIRYFYPRDMWQRWRLKGKHDIAHEPFASKAYAWSAVKNDYWFKLPQLHRDQLRALTGLKTLEIKTATASLVFDVKPDEKLASPRLKGPVAGDVHLNNAVDFARESAAVLQTPTGTWLLVKPQLVDVYVDMLKRRAGGGDPLPVYGYVLEDLKALIVLKLPAGFSLPRNELGFFRKS